MSEQSRHTDMWSASEAGPRYAVADALIVIDGHRSDDVVRAVVSEALCRAPFMDLKPVTRRIWVRIELDEDGDHVVDISTPDDDPNSNAGAPGHVSVTLVDLS
jgi:hypothetical protein